MREPPPLSNDLWMVLGRCVARSRARKAPLWCREVADVLAAYKLVKAYEMCPGVFVLIPTHRGEKELARWRRGVVPGGWPG